MYISYWLKIISPAHVIIITISWTLFCRFMKRTKNAKKCKPCMYNIYPNFETAFDLLRQLIVV